jgi:hypothetical protein
LVIWAGSSCATFNREAFLQSHSLDRFMADRPPPAALLLRHPGLEQRLRAEWEQLIENYRIYWDNGSPGISPVADHAILPEHQLVVIRVSKKLSAVDQLVALVYETCNAQGHFRFNAVAAQAAAAKITREQFTIEIDKREYAAGIRAREVLLGLMPLSRQEVAATTLYQSLLELPDGFPAYQAWCNDKHDQNRLRAQESYGRQYDQLVNQSNGR